MSRKIYKPHPYQERAIKAIIKNPSFALFLDMGLGKTVSSLTAFKWLYDDLQIDKALVIAPKRVAESTWDAECEIWEHLKGLRIAKILGTEKKRIAALESEADIYVMNRENTVWLVDYLTARKRNPFDMLIIDELSSFKSPSAKRFKALKKLHFKRTVGLTGTPAPNGEMDLWPQIYLLDKGKRLGSTITKFRNNYFTPGWSNGNIVYKYNIRQGASREISRLLSDICLSMKAEDYLSLPERMNKIVPVRLRDTELKTYKQFERDAVLAETEITAINAAALAGKLCQFANGAIYDEDRNVHQVHEAKLDALAETIERLPNENVLVAYNYKHDLSRIKSRFPEAVILEGDDQLRRWNDGKIKMLLAHPASAGHGLNLQKGGNVIIWFGLCWSLELYQQFNARLHRQGQVKPVTIVHLVTAETFDERIISVLTQKAATQDSLLQALKDRRKNI